MKYQVVDAFEREYEVEADRVEVNRDENGKDRIAFWKGEVIVAMFWEAKSFVEASRLEMD